MDEAEILRGPVSVVTVEEGALETIGAADGGVEPDAGEIVLTGGGAIDAEGAVGGVGDADAEEFTAGEVELVCETASVDALKIDA